MHWHISVQLCRCEHVFMQTDKQTERHVFIYERRSWQSERFAVAAGEAGFVWSTLFRLVAANGVRAWMILQLITAHYRRPANTHKEKRSKVTLYYSAYRLQQGNERFPVWTFSLYGLFPVCMLFDKPRTFPHRRVGHFTVWILLIMRKRQCLQRHTNACRSMYSELATLCPMQ